MWPISTSVQRYSRRLLVVIIGIAACQGHAQKADYVQGTSHFSNAADALSDTLGNCSIDGQLRTQYTLFDSDVYRKAGLSAWISHELVPKHDGSPRSTWKCAGLITYIVPDGRHSLRWQPPGGDAYVFNRQSISSEFSRTGKDLHLIRQTEDGVYEIEANNGTIWRYANGCLFAIAIPDIGEFAVRCYGSHIQSITLKGEQIPEIRIEYDTDLQPTAVWKFGVQIGSFVWNVEGRLLRWTDERGGVYEFRYDRDLLSQMSYNDSTSVHIKWAENKNWRRGDSKWPCAVHLSQFGDRYYKFTMESRGWVTSVRDADGRRIGEVCYNPLGQFTTIKRGGNNYVMRLYFR